MSPSFRHRFSTFIFAVFAISLLFLPPIARAADTAETKKSEVTTFKDVAYYNGEDMDKVKHKLDLYLPKDKKGYPVLFFIHGGAWVHGDKTFLGIYSGLGRFYASQGIGVVVTNYRLSPQAEPVASENLKLKAQAKGLHGNPRAKHLFAPWRVRVKVCHYPLFTTV